MGSCKTQLPEDAYAAADVSAYHKKGRKTMLCQGCRDRGCTERDPKLYLCSKCYVWFGRQKFPTTVLNNHLKRGDPLHCAECRGPGSPAAKKKQ